MLGALVRYAITDDSPSDGGWFVHSPNTTRFDISPGLPVRTIVVNLIGCLLLGALVAMLKRADSPGRRRLIVAAATGFCGSLTTFSTFATDAARLLRTDGSLGDAVLYLVISILGGAVAFMVGRTAVSRATS